MDYPMKIQIRESGQWYTLGGDYTPNDAAKRIAQFTEHYVYRSGNIGTHVKNPGNISIKREFRLLK